MSERQLRVRGLVTKLHGQTAAGLDMCKGGMVDRLEHVGQTMLKHRATSDKEKKKTPGKDHGCSDRR